MSDRKMTQWEYAMTLLPYDDNMTQDELAAMPRGPLSIWIERTKAKRAGARKEAGKMTQWEYAMTLLPYDEEMTKGELVTMPRQTLSAWIRRTKVKRKDALKSETEELAREYQELCQAHKNDLRTVAEQMTVLEKKSAHEYEGACPLCKDQNGFFVSERDSDHWWNCRACGKGGDIAHLLMLKNNISFWEAVEELAGYSPKERKEVAHKRTYAQVTPQSNKSKELADLTAKFGTCRQTFSENSLVAMAYFGKRELGEQTVLKNRVGMIQTRRGVAIAYPCERLVDGVWQIVGINRRYLDAEQVRGMIERAKTEEEAKKIKRDNPKTKLTYGGNWGVYRLRRIKGAIGLLVVEGEENSLSVWQAARAKSWPCDVVSIGCQDNFKSLRDDIGQLASGYQHLLVWADRQSIADKALGFYGHPSALAIDSPDLAGYDKPADANAMLIKGDLPIFLAHQLTRLSAKLTTGQVPVNGTNHQPDAALPNMPTNEQAPTHQPDMATNGQASNVALPDAPYSSEDEDAALWARRATECDDSEESLSSDAPDGTFWDMLDEGSEIPLSITGREWIAAPATDDLTEQDIIKSERIHWDAPDVPDAHTLPTNAPTAHAPYTNGTQPVRSDTHTLPTTRPTDAHTLPTNAQPTHTANDTASDELLALCASLCSQVADKQKARRWYLTAESHYTHGDVTSLWGCYQAIQNVMGYQVEPNFPCLPPVSPSSPSEFDQPDAYHEWIWAARAVKLGDTTHLGQAWEWARKIEDEELRGEALREMRGMTGGSVGKQLTLLEAAS